MKIYYCLIIISAVMAAVQGLAQEQPVELDKPESPAAVSPATSRGNGGAAGLDYEARKNGILAFEDHLYDSAERFFVAFRDSTRFSQPAFVDATILLVKTCLRQGDAGVERAEKALRHYREHSGDKAPSIYYQHAVNYWTAAVYMRRQRLEEAEKLAVPVAADEESGDYQGSALGLLASIKVRQREWAAAEKFIAQAMEKRIEAELRLQLQLYLCRIYMATDRVATAAEILGELEKRDERMAVDAVVTLRIIWELAAGNTDAAFAAYQAQESRRPNAPDREWWFIAERLGIVLRAAGKLPEAVTVFSHAAVLAVQPEARLNALIQQLECLIALGRSEAAQELAGSLKQQFAAVPEIIPVMLKVGELLKRGGRLEAAAVFFDEIVKNEKAPSGLRYRAAVNRAWGLRELQNYAEAETVFSNAAKLTDIPYAQAQALIFAGDTAVLAKDFNTAALRYYHVAENYPSLPLAEEARLKQARARAKSGLPAGAAAVYAQFLKDFPESAHAGIARFERGVILRQAGDFPAAIEELRKFAADLPGDENTPQALLEAYMAAAAANETAQALKFLNIIIQSYGDSPLHHTAWHLRVHLYFTQGDYELAVTDADEFLKRYSKGLETAVRVLMWLGDYYANQQLSELAERNYLRIVDEFKASPHAPAALYEAAYSAFFIRQDRDKSLQWGRKLVAEYENAVPELIARTHILVGDVLAETGGYAEAEEHFRKAYEIAPAAFPEKIAAQGRLADMYYSMALDDSGNYEKAEAIYREILQDVSSSQDSRQKIKATYRLGKVLEKTGRTDEAIQEYSRIFYDYLRDLADKKVPDWLYFVRSGKDMAELIRLQNGDSRENHHRLLRIYRRLVQSGIPEAVEYARNAMVQLEQDELR